MMLGAGSSGARDAPLESPAPGASPPGDDSRVSRFVRSLPVALAARRNLVSLTESVLAGLALSFEATCGYYSRRGVYEEQVFISGGGEDAYPAAVSDVYAVAQTAFMSGVSVVDAQDQPGLPRHIDHDGCRVTFVWLAEARAGAFVIDRGERVFDAEALDEAAACCALAAEVVAVGTDIFQLEAETRHDFLTGLLNRSYFEHTLPAEIERAKRSGADFSLVFMDLDGFKRFNDSFGHRRGDEFLRQVGIALSDTLRRADIATRYGGDEFGLIFPNTTPDQALVTLARLRERIEAISHAMGADAVVGASFGLAHFPTEASVAEDLIHLADSRLYHSKHASRSEQAGRTAPNGRDSATVGGPARKQELGASSAQVDTPAAPTGMKSPTGLPKPPGGE